LNASFNPRIASGGAGVTPPHTEDPKALLA